MSRSTIFGSQSRADDAFDKEASAGFGSAPDCSSHTQPPPLTHDELATLNRLIARIEAHSASLHDRWRSRTGILKLIVGLVIWGLAAYGLWSLFS